jgi:hypothetical protein
MSSSRHCRSPVTRAPSERVPNCVRRSVGTPASEVAANGFGDHGRPQSLGLSTIWRDRTTHVTVEGAVIDVTAEVVPALGQSVSGT